MKPRDKHAAENNGYHMMEKSAERDGEIGMDSDSGAEGMDGNGIRASQEKDGALEKIVDHQGGVSCAGKPLQLLTWNR